MGVDRSKLIIPGHGTYFTADRNATFPTDPLTAFTLTGTPPAGWDNIGHTSKDNTVAFARDGGEMTSLDTWLQDTVDAVYDSVNWTQTIAALQVDKNVLDHVFNGIVTTRGGYAIPASNNGVEKQGFLLATGATASIGFWQPAVKITMGDAPSFDPTKFLELPMSVAILAADSDKIEPMADGRAGIMELFFPGLVPPTITNVSPSSAEEGDAVTLTGTGLAPSPVVKVNGVTATVTGTPTNTGLTFTMPAGTAGTKNITVSTAKGTSAAATITQTSA